MAHERIHSRKRIAFGPGKGQERVVKVARFRNRRTRAQHVKIPALDAVQNLLAAPAEQLDVDCQFAIDHSDEWTPALEPLTRSFYFEFHEPAERGGEAPLCDVSFSHSIAFQIFEGKINAAFAVID